MRGHRRKIPRALLLKLLVVSVFRCEGRPTRARFNHVTCAGVGNDFYFLFQLNAKAIFRFCLNVLDEAANV